MKKSLATFSVVLAAAFTLGTIPAVISYAEDPAGVLVYETNFTEETTALKANSNSAYTTNGLNGITEKEYFWLCDTADGSGYKCGFGTDATKLALYWGPGHKYQIQIDWEMPEGMAAGNEFMLHIEDAQIGTRAYLNGIVAAPQEPGQAGTYNETLEFNGTGVLGQMNPDEEKLVRLTIVTNNLKTYKINKLTITDLSGAEPAVVFDTNFSEATDILVANPINPSGFGAYDVSSIQSVGPMWVSSAEAAPEGETTAFSTNGQEVPLKWGGEHQYKVEFDWTLPYGLAEGSEFAYQVEEDAYQRPEYLGAVKQITAAPQNAGASGHYSEIIAFNGKGVTGGDIPDDLLMRLTWKGKSLQGFTIANLKITDMNPNAVSGDKVSKVLFESDFENEPNPVELVTSSHQFSPYPVSGVENGKWICSSPEMPSGYLSGIGTNVSELPLFWGPDHSYRIRFDWEVPDGMPAGSELMLMIEDYANMYNRATLLNIELAPLEAGTSGTFDRVLQFSGPALQGFLDTNADTLVRAYIVTKNLKSFTIDNIVITDLNYIEPITPDPGGDNDNEEEAQPIDVTIRLVDGNNIPLASQWIKLDSSDLLQTDSQGRYTFHGVESGAHTINVTDKDGNLFGQAYFTILGGSSTDINGNYATIDSSVTALTVTLSYADGSVNIEKIVVGSDGNYGGDGTGDGNDGDIDNVDSDTPQTDASFPIGMATVVLTAGAALLSNLKRRSTKN